MITPPNYKPDAKADVLGWRHRQTGELLEVRRFTQEQVDEYEAAYNTEELVKDQADADLAGLTKVQLQEYADSIEVEYFASWSKADLIDAIKEAEAE